MKTEDILSLDCRKEENKRIIQKALRKLKPFKRYEDDDDDIPQEKVEKFMEVLQRKYEVQIQYIMPAVVPNEIMWWTLSIKRTDNHSWLGSVYGHDMYETLCKAIIKMVSEIKVKDIPERKEKK